MSSDERNSNDRAGEGDLLDLWRLLWAHKVFVALVTIAFGLVAVVVALKSTQIYRAEVTVTEARQDAAGGAGGLASQLGGLAGLAGVSLGGGAGPQQESRAVLKSRYLVEEFIKRNDLLPELTRGSPKPLTLWLGTKKFQEGIITIREDVRQGLIFVAIEWTDAATAARWANGIVALANNLLRTRALEDSKRNIAYLKEQASQTDIVALQRVMYDLIESETKTLMLANGRTEYAFIVVDPATPPEIRTRPHRTIMVLVGGLMGFFLAGMIVLVRGKVRGVDRALPQST